MKKGKTLLWLLLALTMITSAAIVSFSSFKANANEIEDDLVPKETGILIFDYPYYIDSQEKLATIAENIYEGEVKSISFDVKNEKTNSWVKSEGLPESDDPIDYGENHDYLLYTLYEISVSKTYEGSEKESVMIAIPGGLSGGDVSEQLEFIKSLGFENKKNCIEFTDSVVQCKIGKKYMFFTLPYGTNGEMEQMVDAIHFAIKEGTSGDQFGYVEMKEFLEANPDLLHAGSGDAFTGDVNGDGSADSADATMILRYDAGLIELDDGQLAAADFNGDGSVDSADSTAILRADAGLE